jgi:hypothetical protein
MKAWSWKRGSLVVSLLALLSVTMLLTGCLGIIEGAKSPFTLLGPNGQQITGTVSTSIPDGGIMTISFVLDKSNKTCTFNPEVLHVKTPSAASTTSFQTTLVCNNQQSIIQGDVDQQGIVSMTVAGWTS